MSGSDDEPDLVPELSVTDLARSLAFWRDLIGFDVRYERPVERFAYLALGRAHVMLDQIGEGRTWITGDLAAPLGRGIDLEIQVPDVSAVVERLRAADWPLFAGPEERWYRTGSTEVGVRQVLAQDPDGYLLRPQEEIGERRWRA